MTTKWNKLLWILCVVVAPLFLGLYILDFFNGDLSVPLIYTGFDDVWQLVLTKVLLDTGWILYNPYLGAPAIASWHHNVAAQTSSLHSILMLGLSIFIDNAVKVQQIYYLINFSLISLSSFIACRLLGISRLPAFCVGLLYAFTTFRINGLFYSFLSNYFMIPLALVAVIWIISGEFRNFTSNLDLASLKLTRLKQLVKSKKFILGFLFISLMTLSDGYYAFFTLLLLCFAFFVRILLGDRKAPLSLFPPIFYIFSMMVISLLMMVPLEIYKDSHRDEFYPNGVKDSTLFKDAFEAEVYSSSLKLMIAPSPCHPIERFAEFGNKIVETSNDAKRFKRSVLVPLGSIGTILLLFAFVYLGVPALRERKKTEAKEDKRETLWNAFLSLIFFVFLCSIFGGIGTLIALVFPTIRAYDRFPLFLLFLLYAMGAYYATRLLANAGAKTGRYAFLLLLLTAVGLWDQIPRNGNIGNKANAATFLAERKFVKEIETSLPANSMVYQYPYSQYLRNNDYYGWGSFSHIRLYLHSKALRWSNGAAKNSPVDNWHLRLSKMPFEQMLTEIRAAGFNCMVVDNTVVSPEEYKELKYFLLKHLSGPPIEDAYSKLAFFKFKPLSYKLKYEDNYQEVKTLEIFDKTDFLEDQSLARLLDSVKLKEWIKKNKIRDGEAIVRSEYPDFFLSDKPGRSDKPIIPLSDLKGSMQCSLVSSKSNSAKKDTVLLIITNDSDFEWKINHGGSPLQIGIHLRNPDGNLICFDNGFRVPIGSRTRNMGVTIAPGKTEEIRIPISELDFGDFKQNDLIVEFCFVQDGHAWFGNVSDQVLIRK